MRIVLIHLRGVMQALEVLAISKEAIWVLLKISAPLMLVSMIVGLLISFVQTLTQIQELTLVFVPKILALFFTLLFFSGFIGRALNDFFLEIMHYF